MLRCCGQLLLRGGGLHGGGVSGRVGLWDVGELLQLLRLPGSLPGMLLHLLPIVDQPIRGGLHDDVTE